jgi:hypothetical protein
MITEDDLHGLRHARVELTKRGIDASRADVRVRHGVLSIRGPVRRAPDFKFEDLKHEMEHLAVIMRQRAEIREVILDVIYLD